MDRPLGPTGAHTSDELPCIWMTAGLVAYRLCDRSWDCDDCPFDAAMRGAKRAEATVSPGPGSPLPYLIFPGDRRYHRGHTWARIGDGGARVGLDSFAARLLSSITGTILPAVGTRLRQGQVGCWLVDGPEVVAIRSPVSGTVTGRNGAVLRRPAVAVVSPYDAGWLFDVRLGSAPPDLLAAGEMHDRGRRHLDDLGRRAAAHGIGSRPDLGVTLADGGEPADDLRDVLGRRTYYRWIRLYL